MPDPDFNGNTVVITGAGRGLGFGMARRFGQVGAHVVVAEIESSAGSACRRNVTERRIVASFEPLDVRYPAQSVALADNSIERGQIDVWVNNAGIAHIGPAETLPLSQWDESIAVMLSGSFYCAQAVGCHMLARGRGVIVNMGSVDSYKAIEEHVASAPLKRRFLCSLKCWA